MKLTHASVFSGIGGPEVAATMLGWDNLFHCEINPFGRAVLDYLYPNAKSYEDITTTDFSEWRGRVTVLTGGFPCQPFSYAGQRRGAQDDRYLWPYMFRCIDQVQPDWVVAENVAGITTMVEQGNVSPMAHQASLFDEDNGVQRYQLRETFTLERICTDLESHGYEVQPVLIPACAVGAPHRRDRVFIVGHRIASGTDDRSDGRSASATIPEDSLHFRCSGRPNEKQGSERNEWHTCAGDSQRLCGETSGTTPTDTPCSGEGTHRASGGEDGGIAGCGRWDGFPSVSPVHRGNDGLPFDVDRLTLPFEKWRTEALKAYGNAIVPQVMVEIFRAIEMTYQ